MAQRQLQRNAADEKQVKYAERAAQRAEERFLTSLAAVMSTPTGRIAMWGILGLAAPDQSVYDPSGSTMYFKEGQRNITLALKAKLLQVDEDLYLQMESEMRAMQRADLRGAEAVQTRSAEEGEDTTNG